MINIAYKIYTYQRNQPRLHQLTNALHIVKARVNNNSPLFTLGKRYNEFPLHFVLFMA